MINEIIDSIKSIAEGAIKYPPKSQSELQSFLVAWYCDKYSIPFTDEKVQRLEFETLLLEFYLANQWKTINEDIQSGKYEQEIQSKADEEWMKEQMGEEFHEDIDYLQTPTETEKQSKVNDLPEDIEDDFGMLGGDE